MGDGLEGRRLTGLLTVKRENFPGMREFGWVGGRALLERGGPEEEVRLGLWVLLGGVSIELEGRDWRTQEGVTPYRGPASAPGAPFSAFPGGKEEALGLHSRSQPLRPLQPASRGGECGGETRQREEPRDGLRSALRLRSER